jgi:hypothetical protein
VKTRGRPPTDVKRIRGSHLSKHWEGLWVDTSVCYTTYTIKATFYTELRHCGVIQSPPVRQPQEDRCRTFRIRIVWEQVHFEWLDSYQLELRVVWDHRSKRKIVIWIALSALEPVVRRVELTILSVSGSRWSHWAQSGVSTAFDSGLLMGIC